MRAFLFIGLAYFALGVIVPGVYLAVNKVDPSKWPADPGFLQRGVMEEQDGLGDERQAREEQEDPEQLHGMIVPRRGPDLLHAA